jgi:asparagine synthase (glutamine-hydrolysing)
MCGITALIDLRERRPVNEPVLHKMNDVISHRGPDGFGFHTSPGVGLGHRRLSIIDLEGGKQPLYNEDGSVVVTYNGEIFNFAELVTELTHLGHTFRTRCDTEVIVHAWEEWGEKSLQRFNGMFAFVLWDERKQRVFIARDRLGVKPLHYAVLPSGWLVVSSELKGVIAHPEVPRRVDARAVESYFAFGYVPDPDTIYADAKKLEPGCYLSIERGRAPVEQRRYWDVPLLGGAKLAGSEEDLAAELRRRLQEAVRLRLVADVPLGAFLSGGIDSSAVVAVMREIGTPHLLTCSIGFREREFDESAEALRVSQAKNTDHKTQVVEAADYSLLDHLIDVYDEPYADSSAIPTYRVCALAREHVTVALSGDGGDENLIGYRRYKLFAAEQAVRSRVPLGVRQAIFGPLGRVYPKLDWAPRFLRGKTTFQALARDTVDAYLHGVSIMTEETRRQLFSPELQKNLQGFRANEVFRRYVAGRDCDDALALVQYLDFKTYLPGDILTKVDRASMAHGLEVRTPFLDYTFVEWVASLPTRMKLKRGEGKYLLKRSLTELLPHETLYRTKKGFAVPLDLWFRGSLRERVQATLEGVVLRDSGLFDTSYLQRMWSEHTSGRRNHSAGLWALLMFDQFLRKQTAATDVAARSAA